PRPWVRTAGAVTVDATDPVSAHTDAAAIATTVTASTSQPWGRAKRTGRSSSSGDWSLARACWRNCTGLPSPVETVRRTAEAELWKRNGTRVRVRVRAGRGCGRARERRRRAPEPWNGSGTRAARRRDQRPATRLVTGAVFRPVTPSTVPTAVSTRPETGAMPSTAPVRVFTAFTDRPPETLSSSASEISAVSTWGVEFMMELPFVWVI